MDQAAGVIDVIIEIPRGSRNKYEWDDETGRLRLDRVLYSSVHYPTDYGFVPGKRAEDGDHLDVLVVVNEPTFPGCMLKARPIGVLEMTDEKGLDYKVLAVPAADPRFDEIADLKDLPSHWLREIENFFSSYKALEAKETDVRGWHGAGKAWEVIRNAHDEEEYP